MRLILRFMPPALSKMHLPDQIDVNAAALAKKYDFKGLVKVLG